MAKKRKPMQPWVQVPDRDFWAWFSDWLVSNMVMQAYLKGGNKLPKRIRVPKECVEEQKDGSALLHFEVQY